MLSKRLRTITTTTITDRTTTKVQVNSISYMLVVEK